MSCKNCEVNNEKIKLYDKFIMEKGLLKDFANWYQNQEMIRLMNSPIQSKTQRGKK